MISGFNISQGWRDPDPVTGLIGADDEAWGAHAVLACRYHLADDKGPESYGWQNSWADWGEKGFGKMTRAQFDRQFMYGLVLE